MSTQLFPFAVWLAGTNQNSIPANDNALRAEVIAAPAIDVADSEPGAPSDGDVHIVGTTWGGFATDDVVIYRDGNWYGFEPFEGWLKRLLDTGDLLGYDGSDGWAVVLSGGGGGGGDTDATYLTVSDETASLPNSRRVVAGSNVSLNTSTPGEIVISAGGGGGGGGIDPRVRWEEYDDLIGQVNGNSFTSNVSSGGSVTWTGGSAGHPGVVSISTGSTTSTSNGFLKAASPANNTNTAQVFAGGGELTFEALIEIPTLFGGGNAGQLRCGFFDEITGAPTNGIHAQHDESTTKWRLFCRDGGAANVAGGTDVTTGWHHVKIVVNAAGTEAELIVDGVSQGSVTSNVPTAGMSYGAQAQKTAGSTAAVLNVDLLHVYQDFSSPRW